MFDIIYEDNHLLVVNKPANLASQSDQSQDISLVDLAKSYLKETYHKPNNVYLGLIHRLDRPVSGLMVLAKTSKAAMRLSKQFQQKETVIKEYQCLVEHYIEPQILVDYLAKNKKTNTAYVSDKKHGKLARLQILSCEYEKNDRYRITLHLFTGRSHQIRIQLASRNHPIIGDQRYHPHPIKTDIKLCATRLAFIHPTLNTPLNFTISAPF